MINILSLTLTLTIPITLGALYGTISERGGIIMLGVEGMMLIGAFCAVLGSYATGSAWLGVLFALAVGALMGFLYCLLCLRFKAHQSVIGVGLNLFASGITRVLLKAVWQQEGMSTFVNTIGKLRLPVLSDVPILCDQSVFFYIMLGIVALTWFMFYHTKYGLRYRAIGDHPLAVQTVGVNVNRYRYVALTIAGMLAALGGSFLSVDYNNLFVADMVSGRGFMALAASIFGGWTPIGCLWASAVFAFSQAVSYNMSNISISIYFVQMLPYVTTLLILMITGRRVRGPEALGTLVE